MRTYVIAEAGSSHDGLLKQAVELVHMAKQVGASAVKFQYAGDVDKYADRRNVPKEYREVYRRYAVPESWLGTLHAAAKKHGLGFGCTAYLPEDVAVVAPFADFFKVASFESDALDLLEAIAAVKDELPVYVSLGLAGSPDAARKTLGSRAEFLHCVSGYPVPPDELNLARMTASPGVFVGFSDHSGRTETGALAVAAGAKLIEAHLRLDSTDKANPDYPHSLNPEGFAHYVGAILKAEGALGTGKNVVQPSERPNAQFKVQQEGKDGKQGKAKS